MAGNNSDYLERKLCDWLKGTNMPTAPAAIYDGLFNRDPTDAGCGTEVTTTIRTAGRIAATFGKEAGICKQMAGYTNGVVGSIDVDAAAAGDSSLTMYTADKAANPNKFFRWLTDAATSAFTLAARLNQASVVPFLTMFSLGNNADRIAFLKPFVMASKSNAQGLKTKTVYHDTTADELIETIADAADNTTAADNLTIPRVKGTYLLGTYETTADLILIDAAKYAKANQRALVLGKNDGGDCPPFYVEWFPSSSASAVTYTTSGTGPNNCFRPSVGAASSGNGRWIRVAADGTQTLSSSVATPSLTNGEWIILNDTDLTDITNEYENAFCFVHRGSVDKGLVHDATKIYLKGRANKTLTLDDPVCILKSIGGVWHEISGSPLLNFLQTGSGTNARTTEDKLRDFVNVKDINTAANDGVTDAAAMITATALIGTPRLSNGIFRISTNITLTRDIIVENATISVDSGVTLDFAGFAIIGSTSVKIFTGAGTVSNMAAVHTQWFAADALNQPGTDALTRLQKAYDACQLGAPVFWPKGNYYMSGATPISVTKGQSTIGQSLYTTGLTLLTAAANGFDVNTTSDASFTRITVNRIDIFTPATSGTMIKSRAPRCVIDNCLVNYGYVGVEFAASSSQSKFTNGVIGASWGIGWYVHNTGDIFLNNTVIVAENDLALISSVTGMFVAGEVVRNAGDTARATVVAVGTLRLVLKYDVRSKLNIALGDSITGLTSGATATVGSMIIPHELGGIRYYDQVEAAMVTDIDVIGGLYPFTSDAASNTVSNRPAYCKFSDVYMDSGREAARYNKCTHIGFSNCWWSNPKGAQFFNCNQITFTGGGAIGASVHGHELDATCFNFLYLGFISSGGNQRGLSDGSGLRTGGAKGVQIIGGIFGDGAGAALGFGTQVYGLYIDTNSEVTAIAVDFRGNSAAGAYVQSPSSSIKFRDCKGYATGLNESAYEDLSGAIHKSVATSTVDAIALLPYNGYYKITVFETAVSGVGAEYIFANGNVALTTYMTPWEASPTATPGAGKMSLYHDGSHIVIANNTGSTISLTGKIEKF